MMNEFLYKLSKYFNIQYEESVGISGLVVE